MADALGEAENVIMINLLRWDAAAGGLTALNPQPRYLYASDPDNVGFSNLTIVRDGFVRRQKLILSDVDGNAYAYLALKVVSKALNSNIEKKGDRILVGDYQIPINSDNEMLINFAGPSGTFPVVSFYKIWKLAHEGKSNFSGSFLRIKSYSLVPEISSVRIINPLLFIAHGILRYPADPGHRNRGKRGKHDTGKAFYHLWSSIKPF